MRYKLLIICIIILSLSGIGAQNMHKGGSVSEVKETTLSQKSNGNEVSSKLVNGCTLEVKDSDEKGSYKWKDANTLCESYGEGWRLPTKGELNCLYTNKGEVGGFLRDWYWTSEKVGQFNFWVQSFSNGKQFGYSNSNSAKVRCVRSIKK